MQGLGDGIHRIAVPLPFPAPSTVNSYVFEGVEGLTLLDVGVRDEPGYQALIDACKEGGFSPTDITRVIGSHLHVDHIGGARRLVEELEAEFVMHESTVGSLAWYNDWSTRTSRFAAYTASHGAPPDVVQKLAHGWTRPDWYDIAIAPNRPVADGDRIPLGEGRTLEVVYTPGHQENHIALVDSRTGIWFSGDHILPRISPFIPHTTDGVDTLGHYLDSVERVADGNAGLTMPGHGGVIEHGEARARQIQAHHGRRLQDVLDELENGPLTAWDVMMRIFRPNLSVSQQRLAIQETLAHIEHLRSSNRVTLRAQSGVFWFGLR